MPEYTGTTQEVLEELARTAKVSVDEAYAVVYFLYSGDYLATSDRMRLHLNSDCTARSGWGLTSTQEKLLVAMRAMCENLSKKTWFSSRVYDHPNNDISPFFNTTCIGSLDTVPIKVPQGDRLFHQPKYSDSVVKVLFLISHTGFIMQRSKAYTGSSHDSIILKDSGFVEKWNDNHQFLADGIFSTSTNTIVAARKAQIWPVVRLAGESRAAYRRAAHAKLRANECQAHFRARVEHTFAAPLFNRFKLFSYFKKSDDILEYALEIAMWVLNLEVKQKFGFAGRYGPMTEEYKRNLEEKIEQHEAMSSRYPMPDPLPARSIQRRRVVQRLTTMRAQVEIARRINSTSLISFGMGRKKRYFRRRAAAVEVASDSDEAE